MSSSEFTLREAAKADLATVVDLWRELIAHHVELGDTLRLAPDAEKSWRTWAKNHIHAADSRVVLAEADGRAVGMAVGMERETPPVFGERRRGFITDLYVTAGWRRKGVGRALAEDLLGWFRDRGLEAAELAVASVNPGAEAFWRALGGAEQRRTMRIEL